MIIKLLEIVSSPCPSIALQSVCVAYRETILICTGALPMSVDLCHLARLLVSRRWAVLGPRLHSAFHEGALLH